MVPFPENVLYDDLKSEKNLRQMMNLIHVHHKIHDDYKLYYEGAVEIEPWKTILFNEIQTLFAIKWTNLDDCCNRV